MSVSGVSTSDSQHPTPVRLPCGTGYNARVHPRVCVLFKQQSAFETDTPRQKNKSKAVFKYFEDSLDLLRVRKSSSEPLKVSLQQTMKHHPALYCACSAVYVHYELYMPACFTDTLGVRSSLGLAESQSAGTIIRPYEIIHRSVDLWLTDSTACGAGELL